MMTGRWGFAVAFSTRGVWRWILSLSRSGGVAAAAVALLLAGVVLMMSGCGGWGGSDSRLDPSVGKQWSGPRPDWERTCPTLLVGGSEAAMVSADAAAMPLPTTKTTTTMTTPSATIDLYDLFGGRVEEARIRWVRSADALDSTWRPRADSPGSGLAEVSAPGAAAVYTPPPPANPFHIAAGPLQVRLLDEPEPIMPHRLEVRAAAPSAESESDGETLWFIGLELRLDAIARPVECVLAVRVAGACILSPTPNPTAEKNTPAVGGAALAGFYPIPPAWHKDIETGDGGFCFIGEAGETLDPSTLRIVFGNQTIPVSFAKTAPGGGPDGGGLAGHWYPPDRVVIGGLRLFAARQPSDSILRVFGKTSSGRWVESAFAFGGRTRRLLEPREGIYYSMLIDRAAPAAQRHPVRRDSADDPGSPLHGWLGGNAGNIERRIQSGYYSDLGVTCLVLSPPYRQVDGYHSWGGGTEGEVRTSTAYRGVWPLAFGEPDARLGTREQWQSVTRTAHRKGLSIVFGFAPTRVHANAPLVGEKPEWFSDKAAAVEPAPDPATPPEARDGAFDRREWEAGFLRRATFDENPEAVERMTGFTLWWLRIMNADGFHFLGSDALGADFWRRCTRRLREEVARPAGRGVFLLGESFQPDHTDCPAAPPPGTLDGLVDGALSLSLRRCMLSGEAPLGELARAALPRGDSLFWSNIPCVVSGSPDMPRWASEIPLPSGGSDDTTRARLSDARLKTAFTALFTLPAVPMIYAGDEIGLEGATIPANRAPLPAQSLWSTEERDLARHVGQLARLRARHSALQCGSLQTLVATEDVWVFARIVWKEVVVIALHRGETETRLRVSLPPNLRGARRVQPVSASVPGGVWKLSEGELELTLPAHAAEIRLLQ